MTAWITVFAALALAACATTPSPRNTDARDSRAPVTILVSIDGFRPDYLDRGVTPAMSKLAAGGVQARMRPSFPSKTFPNHYAIVTGLVPDHNGIVANRMEDARRPDELFTMATDDPFWWNEAEPVWVAAEKAGIRTATMFWPGANVAIGGEKPTKDYAPVVGGTRPSDWQQFNQAVSGTQRVNAVIDWMRRPAAIRPRLVTLYFDTVDTAGHEFGPNDRRTNDAVAEVDAHIAALLRGLAELGQPANLVIVADHGMAETSDTRTVRLDTVADPADYRVVESGPYASLHAVPGHEAALEAKLLGPHPHAQCWHKSATPARLRYGTNPRVPPYLCLADDGWLIVEKAPKAAFTAGNHGYDNAAPDMAALFVANGPAFARGRTIAPFDNVSIAALLSDLVGLPPAAMRDGDDTPFRGVMAR